MEKINEFCFTNGLRKDFKGDGNPDIDLYECFLYFQDPLLMNGFNQAYCNDCGKLCDTLYGTYLYSLPKYLILNLNRGKETIYKCNVKFPEILKLNNYVKVGAINSIFRLKSIICNIANNNEENHFIAYCRHNKDNNWYKYDYSIVTKCFSQKEYLNGIPFILFYESLDRE